MKGQEKDKQSKGESGGSDNVGLRPETTRHKKTLTGIVDMRIRAQGFRAGNGRAAYLQLRQALRRTGHGAAKPGISPMLNEQLKPPV